MIQVLEMVTECSSPALSSFLKTAKNALEFIQIMGPILLIISLVVSIVKLINNPEDKKLVKNIKNSIIATLLLFFMPIFINATMGVLGNNFTISACWNNIVENNEPAEYIEAEKKEKNILKILIDQEKYEPGEERKKESDSGSSGEKIEGTAKKVGDVVWDSSDVTKISNLTSSQLIAVLNAYGGNAKNFIPYASGLITAEHKHNVNVFFLIGVEALESGWITSSISRKCNNLGGVCSSSAHPSNGCGSNSNCSFAHFSSVNEFVDYHADMLHKNYLTPGGSYYHGTSPSAVVTNYCPGCSSWPGNVTSIADGLFNKVSSVL